jgi:DNA topoisomerase-1
MIPRTTKSAKENLPSHSAHIAGLRYLTDDMPGIVRAHAGKGFRYRYPTGDSVQESEVLGRIKALAIPPAWKDVWICPDPAGHLQATGIDERGRKQFRYHKSWREIRDGTKYGRMIDFGKTLPSIRKRVRQDLAKAPLCRAKVLATVLRLLELSLIRIGNEAYARENKSYGLTTMRDKHVDIHGSKLRFHFRGKSGKWHDVDIHDARLARIVKQCQDLPGQELFQYVNEDGKRQKLDSDDVNRYLREITGSDFTAKDFRTWAGTVLGAVALSSFEDFRSQSEAKKNIVRAIEQVSGKLGNTMAICRKCYVHPDIINCYMEGKLVEGLKTRLRPKRGRSATGLRAEEKAVLSLLKQRLALQRRREQQLPKLLERSLSLARKKPLRTVAASKREL